MAARGNAYHGLEEAVQRERTAPLRESVDGSARSLPVRVGKVHRLHAVWPGKSRFYCNGHCMTGDFSSAALCTWSCILVPFGLYCVVVMPTMWKMFHPSIPLASLALFVLTVVLLCSTCCSDPGVIPRRRLLLASRAAGEVSETLGYNVLGLAPEQTNVAEGDQTLAADMNCRVPPELASQGYRWCRTCEIIRPPRASHCPDCDHCVLRFDHHCPFVNNCIGQRNYHFFVGFITATICLAIFVLPGLLWWVAVQSSFPVPSSSTGSGVDGSRGSSHDGGEEGDVPRAPSTLADLGPLSFVVVGIAVGAGIVSIILLGFLGYHFFLIATHKTTKEHLRKSARTLTEEAEPTLWAPRGPRLFNPRSWVSMEVLQTSPPRRAQSCEAGVELVAT